MKMKNIIRVLTIGVASLFLLNCVYVFITTDSQPTYNDCGIVLSKSNDEITIKHGGKN